MGRVSEFIYYINQDTEPTPLEKMTQYSHISFTEDINEVGKKYRRKRKRRENNGNSKK